MGSGGAGGAREEALVLSADGTTRDLQSEPHEGRAEWPRWLQGTGDVSGSAVSTRPSSQVPQSRSPKTPNGVPVFRQLRGGRGGIRLSCYPLLPAQVGGAPGRPPGRSSIFSAFSVVLPPTEAPLGRCEAPGSAGGGHSRFLLRSPWAWSCWIRCPSASARPP